MSFIYDDFLSLGGQSFSKQRLVVFYGKSGSGKSTAIEHLFASHPDFIDAKPFVIRPKVSGWQVVPRGATHVIVDEIVSFSDLLRLGGILYSGRKVFVASHVNPVFIHSFFPLVSKKMFITDEGRDKLALYLSRKNIWFSDDILDRYVKRYGATYTDIDIILAHTGDDDFDRAYHRFERFCSIELS